MFKSIIYYVFQQHIFTARISFNVILNLMSKRNQSAPSTNKRDKTSAKKNEEEKEGVQSPALIVLEPRPCSDNVDRLGLVPR